jgi:hypothetical protein
MTGKAPYRFESHSLQRRVSCEPVSGCLFAPEPSSANPGLGRPSLLTGMLFDFPSREIRKSMGTATARMFAREGTKLVIADVLEHQGREVDLLSRRGRKRPRGC